MFDPVTTINQLAQSSNGVNRLKAMIGARDFTRFDKDSSIAFKFMQGAKNKANYVRIQLNSMDLYDIEFLRIWGMQVKPVQQIENVYCDDLKSLFERETGLALSL